MRFAVIWLLGALAGASFVIGINAANKRRELWHRITTMGLIRLPHGTKLQMDGADVWLAHESVVRRVRPESRESDGDPR